MQRFLLHYQRQQSNVYLPRLSIITYYEEFSTKKLMRSKRLRIHRESPFYKIHGEEQI
jgi:hypothetical protein